MAEVKKVLIESWEHFDAEALFLASVEYTNLFTKVDLENVDLEGGQVPESSDLSDEPQNGDSFIEVHGEENDSEVNAGKEAGDCAQDVSDKDADTLGESDEPSDPSESETLDEDGSENPIQKDEEGIKEVAEATSKNSEDVHGGDEATKDIKDSPNAANDGENEDNQGDESGRGNGPNELLNR